MSFGRWIDDAHRAALTAAAHLRAQPVPSRDILTVLTSRDDAYRQLARLAGLIRGTDHTDPMPLPPASAARILAAATMPRAALDGILAGGNAAVIGLPEAGPETLSARGQRDNAMVSAIGTALGMAGDLLTTPVEVDSLRTRSLLPTTRRHPAYPAAASQPTYQGAALVGGVEHREAVAELARLGRALVAVDRQLLASLPVNMTGGPYHRGREHLISWLASGYPDLLAERSRGGDAVLLRGLQAATAADRAAGPLPVATLRDVVRAINDISTAVHRDPALATIGLTGAVARIGFAATVWSSRVSGEGDHPSAPTLAAAARWKRLAGALRQVRDLRDDVAPAYAAEARAAAAWLRDQARHGLIDSPMATAALVIEAQQTLSRVCGQLSTALRGAWRASELLTGQPMLADALGERVTRAGIEVTQLRWSPAKAGTDDHVKEVLSSLDALQRQKSTVSPGKVIRQVATASFASPASPVSTAAAAPSPSTVPAPQRRAGRSR